MVEADGQFWWRLVMHLWRWFDVLDVRRVPQIYVAFAPLSLALQHVLVYDLLLREILQLVPEPLRGRWRA